MLGTIEGRRRRDGRGWDGWMTSPTQWIWVWASSGCWWWTGKPGVLQSMGSQRVGHKRLNWLNWRKYSLIFFTERFFIRLDLFLKPLITFANEAIWTGICGNMEFVYFVWVVQFIGKKLFIIFLYFCFSVCILVLVSCVFSLLLLVIRARGLSIISVFFIQRTNFWLHWVFSSVQFSSVAQSCPTLCNPMNHSRPGLPVHHQLPEFT